MPHSSTIPSATVTSARLGRRSMIIRTLGVTWHSSRMPITREVEMAVKAQSGVQGPAIRALDPWVLGNPAHRTPRGSPSDCSR